MAEDFLSYVGYELPDDLPKQVEIVQQGFYQHPAGTYSGFMGKLTPKYKNAEGKNCSREDIGAVMSHCVVRLYINKFLGTTQSPTNEVLIGEDLSIPDRQTSELSFPVIVSFNPNDTWRAIKQFEKFELNGSPDSKIIMTNPTNPQTKIIVPRNFAKYYGMKVNFELTFKATSEKQARYIDGAIKLVGSRIQGDLAKFETEMEAKYNDEVEQRKAERAEGYVAPPTTDFGSILGDDNSNPADAYMF